MALPTSTCHAERDRRRRGPRRGLLCSRASADCFAIASRRRRWRCNVSTQLRPVTRWQRPGQMQRPRRVPAPMNAPSSLAKPSRRLHGSCGRPAQSPKRDQPLGSAAQPVHPPITSVCNDRGGSAVAAARRTPGFRDRLHVSRCLLTDDAQRISAHRICTHPCDRARLKAPAASR